MALAPLARMSFIRAISNNEIALVAWGYDAKIPDCLGFSLHRIDDKTKEETPLPAWVGFANQANQDHVEKTTDVWPVQKFVWKDVIPRHDVAYRYKVIPLVGTAEHPAPVADQKLVLTSNPVTMTRRHGDVDVVFNRGILATQALAHSVPQSAKGPSETYVRDRISQPGDPLRTRLAGESPATLEAFLDEATKENGHCHLALYELDDTELVKELLDVDATRYDLILSNSSTQNGTPDKTNASARQALHDAHKSIRDRMLGDGHIGHNKFVVYSDSAHAPQAVLTGSTNWTSTALCAQTNNAVVVRAPALAKAYLDYWQRLRDDDSDQKAPLRTGDAAHASEATLADGSTVRVWFSPNTTRASVPRPDPPAPPDLAEVFDIIRGARHGVLFLAFEPGSPSIMDVVRQGRSTSRICSSGARSPTRPRRTGTSTSTTGGAARPTRGWSPRWGSRTPSPGGRRSSTSSATPSSTTRSSSSTRSTTTAS